VLTGAHRCSQVFTGTKGTHKYSQVLTVHGTQYWCGTQGVIKGSSRARTRHRFLLDLLGPFDVGRAARARDKRERDLVCRARLHRRKWESAEVGASLSGSEPKWERERDLVCRARLHRRSQPVALTKPVGIRMIQTERKVRMTKPCGLPRTPALQHVQRAGRALRGCGSQGARSEMGQGTGAPRSDRHTTTPAASVKVASCKLQVAGCKLQVAGCKLQVACSLCSKLCGRCWCGDITAAQCHTRSMRSVCSLPSDGTPSKNKYTHVRSGRCTHASTHTHTTHTRAYVPRYGGALLLRPLPRPMH
jgi:hypothetical protein